MSAVQAPIFSERFREFNNFVIKRQPFGGLRKLRSKTGAKIFSDTSLDVFAECCSLNANYKDSMKPTDDIAIQNTHILQ